MVACLQCDRFYNSVEVGKVYTLSKASLRNKKGVSATKTAAPSKGPARLGASLSFVQCLL